VNPPYGLELNASPFGGAFLVLSFSIMKAFYSDNRTRCEYCCVLGRIAIAGAAVFGIWMLVNIIFFDALSAMNGQSGGVNGVYLIGGDGRYAEVTKAQYGLMFVSELLVIICFLTAFVCAGLRSLSPTCWKD